MFKAFRPSNPYVRVIFPVALAVLSGCDGSGSGDALPDPEPRVATFSGSSWSVERRPNDRFSTANSIFSIGHDGWPVALRDIGGELWFGQWTGTEWSEELVTTLPAIDEDDQLYSGVMQVDENGNPHAMFVTLSRLLYYVGKQESGWVVTELHETDLSCYDLAIDPAGVAHLLYTDVTSDQTVVASLDESGLLQESALPLEQAACGSISASPNGDLGVSLLLPAEGGVQQGTVELLERAAGSATWEQTQVAADAFYYCDYCYLPELSYRGDGVPVLMYVSNVLATYLVERTTATAEDGGEVQTYTKRALSAAGLPFQATRLKRGPDGSLATVVIVNQSTISLAISSPTADFVQTSIGLGGAANTPRLAWTANGAFVSFWDLDGVWAILPDANGEYQSYRVDDTANEGNYLGGFIAVGGDGVPQVFYNEWHQDE